MKIQSFWFRGSTPFPATLIVGKDTVVCMDALRAKFTRSSLIFPSHEGRGDKPGFTESVFRSTSWLATLHLSFRMLAMHPTKEGYYQHTYSSKINAPSYRGHIFLHIQAPIIQKIHLVWRRSLMWSLDGTP